MARSGNGKPSGLHRALYRTAAYVLFNRISIRRLDAATVPEPILYVGLHRNGALDGIPYLQAAPEATYLISAQLHRSVLMRALMPGIAVARRKDRERGIQADNIDWLGICTEVLVAGGSLFILPEGSSTLGPRHLPFKPGAAQIAAAAVDRGASVSLVPLAIHYERAGSWQTRVDIVIGEAVRLEAGGADLPGAILQTISDRLEATGVNVDSEETLRALEALAFAGTLGTGHPYAENLKRLEKNTPVALLTSLKTVWRTAHWSGAWLFQELPLVPIRSLFRELLELLFLSPLVAAMLILNAPVALLASLASRWLPDDRNVVAFWRAVIGLPVGVIWTLTMVVGLSLKFSPWLALLYLTSSAVGIKAVRPLQIRAVAAHNALLAPEAGPPMRELMRLVAGYLSNA